MARTINDFIVSPDLKRNHPALVETLEELRYDMEFHNKNVQFYKKKCESMKERIYEIQQENFAGEDANLKASRIAYIDRLECLVEGLQDSLQMKQRLEEEFCKFILKFKMIKTESL